MLSVMKLCGQPWLRMSHPSGILRGNATSALAAEALANKDALQVESMNKDMCIVVDNNDRFVEMRTKTDCHLMENINQGLLHRAFSVLLFNSKREFFLTQRSSEKITFPGYWTNACCSHPAPVPDELDDKDFVGIKRAAQRRLHFELGIDPKSIPINDIHFMTRFVYTAPSEDPLWGEQEMDYILVINKDLEMTPNTNELKAWNYVSQAQLDEVLTQAENGQIKLSQWFYKIAKLFLPNYWANLDNLEKCKDQTAIHTETVEIGKTGVRV